MNATFSYWSRRSKIDALVMSVIHLYLAIHFLLPLIQRDADFGKADFVASIAFILGGIYHFLRDSGERRKDLEITDDRIRLLNKKGNATFDHPIANIAKLTQKRADAWYSRGRWIIHFRNGETIEFDAAVAEYRTLLTTLEEKTSKRFLTSGGKPALTPISG